MHMSNKRKIKPEDGTDFFDYVKPLDFYDNQNSINKMKKQQTFKKKKQAITDLINDCKEP